MLAILTALTIDLSPNIPAPKVPTAEQARRARDIVERAHTLLDVGKGHATLQLDRDDLASATALASSLGTFGRFDTRFETGIFVARAGRHLGPFWLNVEARVASSARGFPDMRIKIGDLPLGRALSRAVINGVRLNLRWRGIAVPPLDDLVRSVRIAPTALAAGIHFPLRGRFANQLSRLRDNPVDPALSAMLYCRLIAFDRQESANDFAVIVRRAFLPSGSALPAVEQSRAAFVALAVYTVSPDAARLAADAARRIERCRAAPTKPLLAGREDLAKHWALSAALAVSLGGDIGSAMGEWKELSDSRPGGSGFSFVDLSADRAGLAVAKRATDPATAETTVTRLRLASSEDLLPISALALAEGLSERQFIGKYRAIDSKQFETAIARIDSVIARTVGR